MKMPQAFLVLQRSTQIPEALAQLKGVRLAIVSEVPAKSVFDEELVKSLTGDGTITARKLHENSQTFKNTTTLIAGFNNYPTVTVGGTSWWRRQRIIKMLAHMPDEKADRTLSQRIITNEGGRVLAWMLQGTLEYLAGGELPPEKVLKTVAEYRISEDDMARFVGTELEPAAAGVTVPRQFVYQRYVAFMRENRLFDQMVNEPKFVREFLMAHPDARVITDGVEDVTVFQNYRLRGVRPDGLGFPFTIGG
jgi:P4 family phage/plasmid primase-like protien